ADADVPPFDYREYAAEVERLLGNLRAAARSAGARNPRVLDLSGVETAAADFQAASRDAHGAIRALLAGPPDAQRTEAVARTLASVESALLSPNGLTGRPWYRHTFSAPGINAGYAAVVFPGVREAIERSDWPAARREAEALREALKRTGGRSAGPGQIEDAAGRAGALRWQCLPWTRKIRSCASACCFSAD